MMNHHSHIANPEPPRFQCQSTGESTAPSSMRLIRPRALIFLASIFLLTPTAQAVPTTLKGSLDRIGVSAVGFGVADPKKYAGDELTSFTKQANDYANKYSKDYTLLSKYVIVHEDGKLDTTASTITFSMPTFTTLPIGLTKVTGDFAKSEFTRFEFEAEKWYPNLEKNFKIKNVSFKGFIDLSDAAKPEVEIIAVYQWQESVKGGAVVQPLATLTYRTTAKDNPGLAEWEPFPPGPVSNVPEPLNSTMLLVGGTFVAWRGRQTHSTRASRGQ